jgi:hypothetical protein
MKELANTKATVRLRKVEDRKEWYLYSFVFRFIF